MKAAWYERQGAPASVLVVGKMAASKAGSGEVRIRVAASGINPGDVKKRQDAFGVGMPFPRVVPHSDGGGAVGQCAVALATRAGAAVIATVRSERDKSVAQRAGAHHVIDTSGHGTEGIIELVHAHAPQGVDHIVEVAFDRNIWVDEPLLR